MDPINAFASSKGLGQLESIKSFDVSTTDMQRFERALNEPGLHAASELQPGTDTRGSGELSTIGELENPTVSTQSIGGAFIESIQDIKSTLDARAERITKQLNTLAGSPMSLQDAIRVQYELMQMNMQQELTSKMADKTSQGVQMLFRNQG